MSETQPTALGGTLRRTGPSQWVWSDGTPAVGVTDFHPSWYYNFRVRHVMLPVIPAVHVSVVEVPRQLAMEDEDLAWIRDWHARGGLALDGSTDPGTEHQRTILVPLEAWDAWSSATVLGPRWPAEAEAEILARARALGWQQ